MLAFFLVMTSLHIEFMVARNSKRRGEACEGVRLAPDAEDALSLRDCIEAG
jgi:hypothetical protein